MSVYSLSLCTCPSTPTILLQTTIKLMDVPFRGLKIHEYAALRYFSWVYIGCKKILESIKYDQIRLKILNSNSVQA